MKTLCSIQRRRRGIFVESKTKTNQAPSGAAYPEDFAPDGALHFVGSCFYKDAGPNGPLILWTTPFKHAHARARELLDRAKRAVEIAIEQDEKAALKILEK